MYETNQYVDLILEQWGLDKSVYILAWSIVGFGVGFLIGYATRDLIDKKDTNKIGGI